MKLNIKDQIIENNLINKKDIVESKQDLGIERSNDLSFASGTLKILPSLILRENMWIDENPIVFIHPPKTAGTNVANLAKAITISQNTLELRAVVPKREGVSPNLFDSSSVGGLKTIINNPKNFDCTNKDVKFISGHMPLPSVENEKNYFNLEKLNYVAIIRDPIDRELSSANFDYQRKYVEAQDIQNYIINKPIDNLQTRLLAGENYMSGECNEDTFNEAVKNIRERFIFVAPSEDVEIVMSLISSKFGVDHLAYSRAQITGIKIVDRNDAELCNYLNDKHKFDVRIFNLVKENWNNWKQKYIEDISYNTQSEQKYLVLTPYFSQNKVPEFMNLDQVISFGDNTELVTLQQKLLISDSKLITTEDEFSSNKYSSQPKELIDYENLKIIADLRNIIEFIPVAKYFTEEVIHPLLESKWPGISNNMSFVNIDPYVLMGIHVTLSTVGAYFCGYEGLYTLKAGFLYSAPYVARSLINENLKTHQVIDLYNPIIMTEFYTANIALNYIPEIFSFFGFMNKKQGILHKSSFAPFFKIVLPITECYIVYQKLNKIKQSEIIDTVTDKVIPMIVDSSVLVATATSTLASGGLMNADVINKLMLIIGHVVIADSLSKLSLTMVSDQIKIDYIDPTLKMIGELFYQSDEL